MNRYPEWPSLYGLPKVHKEGVTPQTVKLRPVVAVKPHSPGAQLSWLLDYLLRDCTSKLDEYLDGTEDMLARLTPLGSTR